MSIYLIIDQYKITFDKDYNELKIIQRIANEKYIRIILISSMNEEDVKDSIVTTLSNTKKPGIFTLDYIYVNSLVKCNGEGLGKECKLLLKNSPSYSIVPSLLYKIPFPCRSSLKNCPI